MADNKSIKLILKMNDGTVKELEGEGIVFYLVRGTDETEEIIRIEGKVGVVGALSLNTLHDAEEQLVHIIRTNMNKATRKSMEQLTKEEVGS